MPSYSKIVAMKMNRLKNVVETDIENKGKAKMFLISLTE